jgi:hypothetical protein
MSKDADRPDVVVRGTARTIAYAVCSDGSMPAKEFVEGLDDSDQRKLDTLFRRLADTGKIFNREQFKLVEGEIFEFKRHQVRVGCFQIETRWLLTHGFVKKRDKWPKAELERANRIRSEHLKREQKQRG